MGLTMSEEQEREMRARDAKLTAGAASVDRTRLLAELDATRAAIAAEREHADRLAETGYAMAQMALDLAGYMVSVLDMNPAKTFPHHVGSGAAFMAEYNAHAARRKEASDASE